MFPMLQPPDLAACPACGFNRERKGFGHLRTVAGDSVVCAVCLKRAIADADEVLELHAVLEGLTDFKNL